MRQSPNTITGTSCDSWIRSRTYKAAGMVRMGNSGETGEQEVVPSECVFQPLLTYFLLGPLEIGLVVGIVQICMFKPNSKILATSTSNAAANELIVRILRNLPEDSGLPSHRELPVNRLIDGTNEFTECYDSCVHTASKQPFNSNWAIGQLPNYTHRSFTPATERSPGVRILPVWPTFRTFSGTNQRQENNLKFDRNHFPVCLVCHFKVLLKSRGRDDIEM